MSPSSSPSTPSSAFADPAGDGVYYASPRLSQRLNLLHHLIRYSDLMLLVTGPNGAGKTALLNKLLEDATNPLRVSVVQAGAEMSPTELLQRVLEGFDLRARGEQLPAAGPWGDLQPLVEELRGRGQVPLLVVEEAELLPAEALDYLARMASEEALAGLRILLLGEPQLVPRMQPGAGGRSITHLVELPALTREQTLDYVQLCLGRVGITLDGRAAEADLRTLHRRSGGVPGRINSLAPEVLAAHLPHEAAASPAPGQARPRAGGNSIRRRPPALWMLAAGGLLLVSAVVTALLWRSEGTSPEEGGLQVLELPSKVTREPAPSYEPAGDHEAPTTVRVTPLAIPAPRGPGPLEPSLPLPDSEDPRNQTPPLKPEPATTPRVPTPTPGPERRPEMKPEPTPPPAAAPEPEAAPRLEVTAAPTTPPVRPKPEAAPKPRPKLAAKPPSEPAANDLRGEAWLLRQPAGHYTIQLTGSHDREGALRFIAEQGLRARAAVFHTYHRSKDWYVVVIGAYPSRDTALAAIRALPRTLRQQGPWARTFESVHGAIRQAPPGAR